MKHSFALHRHHARLTQPKEPRVSFFTPMALNTSIRCLPMRYLLQHPFRAMIGFGFLLPWVVAVAVVLGGAFGGGSPEALAALSPNSWQKILFLLGVTAILSLAFTAPAVAFAYAARSILKRFLTDQEDTGESSPALAMIGFGFVGYLLTGIWYFHGVWSEPGVLPQVLLAPYFPLFTIGIGAALGVGLGRAVHLVQSIKSRTMKAQFSKVRSMNEKPNLKEH